MSQRKDKKRKREPEESPPEDGTALGVKRKRLEQVLDRLSSGQHGGQTAATVRRSGRTPKAKVFDDDYVTESVRTPECPKVAAAKSVHSSSAELAETPKTNKPIKKEPEEGETGHKRETRRSYQQYLEELTGQSDVSGRKSGNSDAGKSETPGDGAIGARGSKKGRKRKTGKDIFEQGTSAIPETLVSSEDPSRHMGKPKERTPKEIKKEKLEGPIIKQERIYSDAVQSPKIRASSRTPVPKRSFQLLEKTSPQTTEGEQSNPEEANRAKKSAEVPGQKVRVSTRAPVPKRSFSLVEGEVAVRIKTENMEMDQEVQNSQPSSLLEASPARSSSRAPVPKRAFPLLAGKHSEGKRGEKISHGHKEETSDGNAVVSGSTPKVSVSKKRKKLSSPGLGLSSEMSPVLPSSEAGQSSCLPKQTKKKCGAKVTEKKVPDANPGVAAPEMKRKVKKKISKKDGKGATGGQEIARSSASGGSKDSESQEKLSSNEPNIVRTSRDSLVAEETSSKHASKPSARMSSGSPASKKTEVNVKLEPKVKKHAAKKHRHHHHSPKKSKTDFIEASSEVVEEEKHIILKLHLPHASEHGSKSGSKKHKHKHSSESNDGSASPKKKHHKKSTNERGVEGVMEQPAAKKKISIKFKGLSPSHVDVQGTSSGVPVNEPPDIKVEKETDRAGEVSISSLVQGLLPLESSGKKKKKISKKNAPSDHTSVEADQQRKPPTQKSKDVSKSNKLKHKPKSVTVGSKKKAAGKAKGSPSKKKQAEVSIAPS